MHGHLYTVCVCMQKLALRENNISRYREEFKEVQEIGSGSFGTVYKCINRLGRLCVLCLHVHT